MENTSTFPFQRSEHCNSANSFDSSVNGWNFISNTLYSLNIFCITKLNQHYSIDHLLHISDFQDEGLSVGVSDYGRVGPDGHGHGHGHGLGEEDGHTSILSLYLSPSLASVTR